VRELQPGLWHWQTRHPEWSEGEPWDPNVSSYAIDDGERLLLFDPLGVPDELLERAGERVVVIVLTAPWHERDTQTLVARFGAPVFTPTPDSAEDLMREWGISAERAGEGSPDLRWLLKEGGGEAHTYQAGDRLPFGAEAYPAVRRNDLVLWIPSHQAVIGADSLADFGEGIAVQDRWLPKDRTREQVLEGMRPLLELPIELVLPTHGVPTDRAALERALSG
jgi:hypothetical protein